MGSQICGDSLMLYCVLWMLALLLLYGVIKPVLVHVLKSEDGSVSAYAWRVLTVGVIESLLHVLFTEGLQSVQEGLSGSVAIEKFHSERRLGIWAASLNGFGAFTLSGLLFVNSCIALSLHFFPEWRGLVDAVQVNSVAFSSAGFLLGLGNYCLQRWLVLWSTENGSNHVVDLPQERRTVGKVLQIVVHSGGSTLKSMMFMNGMGKAVKPFFQRFAPIVSAQLVSDSFSDGLRKRMSRVVPPVLGNTAFVVLIIMYSVAELQERALVRSMWEALYAGNERERRRFVSL
ncbi:hypothetical protein FGB62_216g023 [Gracilaria domingensis]|nr:hypothetical protein FGB62_216g023 [Gracilaria domingensis]